MQGNKNEKGSADLSKESGLTIEKFMGKKL